jgi:drug/metabolite transporter (DMT)-like permease
VVDAPLTRDLAELEASPAPRQRPLLGYVMVIGAVSLWAVNATVSKVILQSGMSAHRLSEVRAAGGAALFLAAVMLAGRGATLRVRGSELPWLAAFGVLGLALVQLFYFVSIERLDIGVSLVIEYITPVLVALWARFVVKEPVRRRLWYGIAVALAGLSLVVDLWGGVTLDSVGVGACLLAAVSYTGYILIAEHSLARGRDVLSLLAWGFLCATAFWSIVRPWSSFPLRFAYEDVSLLGRLESVTAPVWPLLLFVLVLGTFVPFILMVSALHHIPATRATIVAMLEPVLAAVVAYVWLEEALTAGQIAGGVLVLAGVAIAQSARPADDRRTSRA